MARHALRRILWYGKIAVLFGKLSLQSQLEYSANFFSGVCVETGYMIIKLAYLYVVMSTGVKIGTLTPDMVMLFVGTYVFMTGIWMLLGGVNALPHAILHGQLDLLMTKPGSLQFLQTFGQFNFALALPNVTAGIALIALGWARSAIPATFASISAFAFYAACGILLTYALALLAFLLIFWVTSVNAVFTMFAALWDYNNMPMELYPRIVKQIGTFVIPIFLVTNWQGMAVLGRLSPFELLWGGGVSVLLFVLSRLLWKKGIRKYTSANG